MKVGHFASGESGIRTHEPEKPATRFPGELLKPLGHLSKTVKFIIASPNKSIGQPGLLQTQITGDIGPYQWEFFRQHRLLPGVANQLPTNYIQAGMCLSSCIVLLQV